MNNKIPALMFIGATLLLSSCGATKYAPMSSTIFSDPTGYKEVPIDTNAWMVTFTGNPATDTQTVNRYALYRAAELTIDNGFDYFVVQNEPCDSATALLLGPHESRVDFSPFHDPVNRNFNTITGAPSPRRIYTNNGYSVTETIRMFNGAPPRNNLNAFNAKSLLAVMGPAMNK